MENVSESDSEIKANTTYTNDRTVFTEYQAALIIWKAWTPCVLLLGSFGNVATFIVMRRIKDHNSSQYAILMALAVSDFALLYSDALRVWVFYLFHVDVRLLHRAVCKVQIWVIYSVNTTSAWLVTSVTVQRTMAVLWPHKMRMVCTVRKTWVVIAAVFFTAFLLHAHLVAGVDLVENGSCYSGPGLYDDFFRFIFPWVDMCVSSFLPCVCLIVCDIILSVTLFRAISSTVVGATSNVGAANNTDSRRKTTSRTTVLVLALSCAFLLLTMPVCVCLIWDGYMHPYIIADPHLNAKKELAYAVTFQLWYTNSSVNFLLYCLTGTKFRGVFMKWILCDANRHSPSLVFEGSSSVASIGMKTNKIKDVQP
ncbi:hypothetical protein ACOMHN_024249 [Nucella lapillus]